MAHLNRKQKLAQMGIKEGPGVFIYLGNARDSHSEPTVLRYGKKEAVFDDAGLPVTDRSGRQVFQRVGQIVVDETGKPKLGGPPKVTYKELSTFTVRGVDFPKGEPIIVYDQELARKLRCSEFFDEQEGKFDELPQKGGRGKARRRVFKLRAESLNAPLAEAVEPTSDAAVAEAVEEHEQKAKRGRPRKSE